MSSLNVNFLSQQTSLAVDRFIPKRKREFSPSTYFELHEQPNKACSLAHYRYQMQLANTLFPNALNERILQTSITSLSSLQKTTPLPQRKIPKFLEIKDLPTPVDNHFVYPITTDATCLYALDREYGVIKHDPASKTNHCYNSHDDVCSITTIPGSDYFMCGTGDGIVSVSSKEDFKKIHSAIFDFGGQICVLKPINSQGVFISSDTGILGHYDIRQQRTTFRKQLSTKPITGISYNQNNLFAFGAENQPWQLFDIRSLKRPLFKAANPMNSGRHIQFSRGNPDLLAIASQKTVEIWNVKSSPSTLHPLEIEEVTSLDWIQDSHSEISVTYDISGLALEYWSIPAESRPWLKIGSATSNRSHTPVIAHATAEYNPSLTHYVTSESIINFELTTNS